MDFDIPADIQELLDQLDQFIEDEIKPLERENGRMAERRVGSAAA